MSDSPSQAGGGEEKPGGARATPMLGQTLGRYTLRAVLGRGAMAAVFRAHDGLLGREVAVKVMGLAIAARSDAAERFRREALAVAGIKHPNIVEVFDFVPATLTEPAYIVSELIEGITLGQFLAEHRGRVLPETAALLALSIAEALAAAHAHGVVHRDLKPDNVMVEVGEATARLVLTDFGVAHVTGLETMTVTGALVGSPSYMSPEQALGKDIGAPSDLWGLGVLLYQMGTGHLPFAGGNAWAVVGAITQGAYKRPSSFDPRAGGRFDEICGRCLERDPARRFPDARALAEALRAYLADVGIEPGPASLRRALSDLDGFEAELRPRVAAAAVTAAREHRRRGDLARALAELARASAYVPGHPEAARLCQAIATRRRLSRVGLGAVVAGSLLAAGGIGFTLFEGRLGPAGSDRAASGETNGGPLPAAEREPAAVENLDPPASVEASESAAGEGAAIEMPVAEAGVGASRTPLAQAERATRAEGERGGRARSGRGRDKGRRTPLPGDMDSPRATEMPAASVVSASGAPHGAVGAASEAQPGQGALEPVSEPALESMPQATGEPAAPTAPKTAAAPARATVKLFATHAFCRPSLDQGEDSESPVIVPQVTVGRHEVYCTMGRGGRRLRAGFVDVQVNGDRPVFMIRLDRGERNTPKVVEARPVRE